MDSIIFGDNQFFGVNHMSEDKAAQQALRFRTADDIYSVLKVVNNAGIKTFMFTTHDRLEPVLDRIKKDSAFQDFKLIPCMPYAHKYANAMVEAGMFGAIEKFLPNNKMLAGLRGLNSAISANPVPVMKLLIDSEMKWLSGHNVEAIFLQNIATDLVLGLGMDDLLGEFATYVETQYGVRGGFITMNHKLLHDRLTRGVGLSSPLICSSINKIGFRMNPSQEAVEEVVQSGEGTTVAMSVLASGAIRPAEGLQYIKELGGVSSVLFGASSSSHIREFKELADDILGAT